MGRARKEGVPTTSAALKEKETKFEIGKKKTPPRPSPLASENSAHLKPATRSKFAGQALTGFFFVCFLNPQPLTRGGLIGDLTALLCREPRPLPPKPRPPTESAPPLPPSASSLTLRALTDRQEVLEVSRLHLSETQHDSTCAVGSGEGGSGGWGGGKQGGQRSAHGDGEAI